MWRRDRNPQNEEEAAPSKRDLSKISVSSNPGGNPVINGVDDAYSNTR